MFVVKIWMKGNHPWKILQKHPFEIWKTSPERTQNVKCGPWLTGLPWLTGFPSLISRLQKNLWQVDFKKTWVCFMFVKTLRRGAKPRDLPPRLSILHQCQCWWSRRIAIFPKRNKKITEKKTTRNTPLDCGHGWYGCLLLASLKNDWIEEWDSISSKNRVLNYGKCDVFTWKCYRPICISCQKWPTFFESVSSWIGLGDVQHYDFSIDVSSEVHSEPKKKTTLTADVCVQGTRTGVPLTAYPWYLLGYT